MQLSRILKKTKLLKFNNRDLQFEWYVIFSYNWQKF